MKVPIITLIILVLFFSCAIYSNIYIANSAEKLSNEIERLDQIIEGLNWHEAQIHMNTIVADWHRTKRIWQTIIEHQDINNIGIALARIERYVEIEEGKEATGDIAELKLLIEQLSDKVAFKLVNIL